MLLSAALRPLARLNVFRTRSSVIVHRREFIFLFSLHSFCALVLAAIITFHLIPFAARASEANSFRFYFLIQFISNIHKWRMKLALQLNYSCNDGTHIKPFFFLLCRSSLCVRSFPRPPRFSLPRHSLLVPSQGKRQARAESKQTCSRYKCTSASHTRLCWHQLCRQRRRRRGARSLELTKQALLSLAFATPLGAAHFARSNSVFPPYFCSSVK